jgi:CheY-like chemotaxis protein
MSFLHPSALIIDDDAEVRNSLAALLGIEGYSVVTAAHGREALQKLAEGARPCIIVLDLQMPEMTGFEFRREQRLHPDFRTIPVIVHSAVHAVEEIAGHLDAHAYVQKATAPVEVLTAIMKHCLK